MYGHSYTVMVIVRSPSPAEESLGSGLGSAGVGGPARVG